MNYNKIQGYKPPILSIYNVDNKTIRYAYFDKINKQNTLPIIEINVSKNVLTYTDKSPAYVYEIN